MFSLNDVGFLGSVSTYDADALAYIRAVEIADTQSLEPGVRDAINAFVVGCKADGIWTAIKASCILAGARTLAGALVPLVGAAPTNVSALFVSADYNRETGLVGNGTTKRLNSNRANTADPQDNCHHAVYATSNSGAQTFIGPMTGSVTNNGTIQLGSTGGRNRNTTIDAGFADAVAPTLVAMARNNSSNFIWRAEGTNNTATRTSQASSGANLAIFGAPSNSVYSNARLAFYSIGESLDLALLDTRVTTLINAIAAAIP
jgi:hypothetical protein